MSKYLELFLDSFDESIIEKTKPENKPYVAYSIKEGKVAYTIVPKEEGPYKMIDLGLPSGLKWADRNVGAASPEDAGLYFQWGDTVGYTADQVGVDKVFNWDSYFDTTDRGSIFNKYYNGGLEVLKPEDDAATVHMGSQYRMPTLTEIRELRDNTTQTFIDLDGNEYDKQYVEDNKPIKPEKLKGVRFTGSNNNSIFIPATGFFDESSMGILIGAYGYLWSSSLFEATDDYARNLNFSFLGDVYVDDGSDRYIGQPVRGVQV